jgi:protocatechuate 3,4-dioxygenase beta subunit
MSSVDPITPTEILDEIIQPIEPSFGPDFAQMFLRLRVGMSRPVIGALIATAAIFAFIIGSMRLQSRADDSLAPSITVAQEPAKTLNPSGGKDASQSAKAVPTVATKSAAAADPDARTMVVHVTDESGVPLANTKLHVAIWEVGGGRKYGNRKYTTNAEGVATVQRPSRLQILRIWPYKTGYVPLFVNFAEGTHDGGKLIPERYEFRLARGTTLSGTVVDENGRPIPGVTVDVSVSVAEPRPWGNNPKPIISTWLTDDDFQDGSVITNKDGKWSIHDAPAPVPGKEFEFRLKFTHKGYISDSVWGELQKEQNVTTHALRDGSARIVLKSGVAVTGTVVDSSGKPVQKGLVIWSDDPYLAEGVNEVQLDGAGRFKTITLPPGERSLTVLAPGFCPERRKVDIAKGMSSLQFALKPGNRLKFRVVDQADNPIPGAYVGIDGWQGAKSLYNEKHPNVPESHVPRKADKSGVYDWEWAPDDAVTYQVSAKGFETTTVKLVATPVEQTVELEASESSPTR